MFKQIRQGENNSGSYQLWNLLPVHAKNARLVDFLQELPHASLVTHVCTDAGIVSFCRHRREESDLAMNPKHFCPECLHKGSTQRLTAASTSSASAH